jgi:hypothetical protein
MQLSPETKIKIDNFIDEVLSKKCLVDTKDFGTKPSLIVEYLEKNGFKFDDNDFDGDTVNLIFFKENPNYRSFDNDDSNDDDDDDDDSESEEPEYFTIRILINPLEYKCCLDTG